MSQVQEQPVNQQQAAQAQPPASSTPPTEQQEPDIFADGFSEADISAMFEADNGGNDGGTPPPAGAPEGTQQPAQQEGEAPQEQPSEQPAEQPKAEEQAQPDAYELPLFGKNVKLTGDQLIQAAEAGIQLLNQRPQVEKAMQLMQAVQTDPNLQAILQAYSNGQPLPAVTRGQQQPMQGMPQPGSQEEALMAFQQQIMQHLMPQVVQAVEAKYKPFVDEVQTFAHQAKMEKAFAPYLSDPEYNAVNSLMTQNLQAKVNEGAISMQQAAEIDAKLKADPELYGQWFGKFKTALKNAQKQAAAAPQPVQTVPHAPKLESSAAAAPTVAERARVGLAKALDGDPNGFNLLFDNQ